MGTSAGWSPRTTMCAQACTADRASGSTRFHTLSKRAIGREHNAAMMARHEQSSPALLEASPTLAQAEITSERECAREAAGFRPLISFEDAAPAGSGTRTWMRTILVSQCGRSSLPKNGFNGEGSPGS